MLHRLASSKEKCYLRSYGYDSYKIVLNGDSTFVFIRYTDNGDYFSVGKYSNSPQNITTFHCDSARTWAYSRDKKFMKHYFTKPHIPEPIRKMFGFDRSLYYGDSIYLLREKDTTGR